MDSGHGESEETEDFIPLGGPTADPWHASGSNRRPRRFGGRQRARGGRYYGIGATSDPANKPSSSTPPSTDYAESFPNNYSGRGYPNDRRSEFTGPQRNRGRPQRRPCGNADISLYCWKALDDPWAKLEAARLIQSNRSVDPINIPNRNPDLVISLEQGDADPPRSPDADHKSLK